MQRGSARAVDWASFGCLPHTPLTKPWKEPLPGSASYAYGDIEQLSVPLPAGTQGEVLFDLVCLKPSVATGVTGVDTIPLCTAECTADGDCAGALRNPNDPNDKGCLSGCACATPFIKGPLCCRKMCVCKDFTGPMEIPAPCQDGRGLTCN